MTKHPFTYEKLRPFELLMGSWIFDWVGHNPDGTTWMEQGEWHFAWILEGRAIQDTWICQGISLWDSVKYPAGQYGTTIRYYNEKEECVKVLWIGSVSSQIYHFSVTFQDNRIIQQKMPVGENLEKAKWIFMDITNNSFTWEGYQSDDCGLVWNLTQEIFARRKNNSCIVT